MHRNLTYLGGPGTEYTETPNIDPWTGDWVDGLYVDHSGTSPPFDCSAAGREHSLDPPADLMDIRAVPFPVGFTLGATGALIVILVWAATSRLTNSPQSRASELGGER